MQTKKEANTEGCKVPIAFLKHMPDYGPYLAKASC